MTREMQVAHANIFAHQMLSEHGYIVVMEFNQNSTKYRIGTVIDEWCQVPLANPCKISELATQSDWDRQMEQWMVYRKLKAPVEQLKGSGTKFWKADCA